MRYRVRHLSSRSFESFVGKVTAGRADDEYHKLPTLADVQRSRMHRRIQGALVAAARMKIRNLCSEARPTTIIIEESKVELNEMGINCARVGSGDHPVLLLPGAMGTIWTDFKPQLEHLSRERFTIVAWDPPGYGKSRPPNRSFSLDFFERDADTACALMKALGYRKFSLLGWSDGAITALHLASAYPENIQKLIVVGGNAYIMQEELKVYESVRDIEHWSERMRAPLLAIYGREYLQRTWSDWVDAMIQLYETRNGDICKDTLPRINSSTLIVHGANDAMVNAAHPVFLKEHIKRAKLRIFEKGSHNLHLRFYDEFNLLVTNFLLEG